MRIEILISFFLLVACSNQDSNNQNFQRVSKEMVLSNPNNFIIENFRDKDIILIGEVHKQKEDLVFLQELLPVLHQNGINTLFFEFANYDDTLRINQLINAPIFNESLARDIVHSFYWEWNYQEYIDVFRAAWTINKNEPNPQEKFRILGLNSTDWTAKRMEGWTEKDWARCVIKETIAKNKKALVYCGHHHSITKFEQPYTINGKFEGFAKKDRMGHYIYKEAGERCMTIWLHSLWPDSNYQLKLLPCNGYLDSLAFSFPVQKRNFAFSTKTSPLGNLTDNASLYSLGHNPIKLRAITDGYILLSPVCKMTFIGQVSDFVNEQNLENTKKQVHFYYGWEAISVQAANDTLSNWYNELKERFQQQVKKIKCDIN